MPVPQSMLGLFAFLAVSAWASSRREQREMELRYELLRRMVEHPGPEAVAAGPCSPGTNNNVTPLQLPGDAKVDSRFWPLA